MKFVFSDIDRKYGKAVGVMRSEGDFRCYEHVDFNVYERNLSERDAGEKCTYCAGPVYLTAEQIAELERPKLSRPVNLAKREVQRFDLLTIAYNLRNRLDQVSYDYDQARKRIAELEAQLSERVSS
ncbi:hypothetical protein [Actinacidiphila glaucinigra]|uniref:Uncharacterized protein n=1 Tax=Actinacidiphila glaucinigra TaxID=235986 RepID=A0A239EZS8_9ACTN|nr:hypothetical protein [Actinacidiphila glaucinigra]SNS50166.1 hypothetical protein SAMN05216252_106239 [Actinacidiphila glaucinigra]